MADAPSRSFTLFYSRAILTQPEYDATAAG
jgi:hypothetical protein